MKALFGLILIGISVGIFFWYIEPAWAVVGQTRSHIDQLQNDILQADQAKTKNDQLVNTYNSFTKAQIDQLKKFLPASIDPIRFVLSLNSVAAQYGSGLSSVNIGASLPSTGQNYAVLPVTFSVAMTYPNFLLFLKDLEHNLPPTDITALSFASPDTGSTYTFTLSAQTYSLQ